MLGSGLCGEVERKPKAPFRQYLGAVALLAAMAPAASWAYIIVCSNGYDVFRCGDGTEITCMSEGTYQIDCPPDATLGSTACADHGGLIDIGPGHGPWVTDYRGNLDLHAMECTDCVSEEPPPVSYAGWLGSCSGKATFACSDMDRDCRSKQLEFKALCDQLEGELSSVWHIDFTPQLACYPPAQSR